MCVNPPQLGTYGTSCKEALDARHAATAHRAVSNSGINTVCRADFV